MASWAAAAVGEMADSELTLCSLSKPEKYIKLFRTFYEINDLAKLINRVITVTKLLLLLYFWFVVLTLHAAYYFENIKGLADFCRIGNM